MGHSSFQSLALERVSLGLACVNGALCIVEANRAFADLVASSEAMVIGAPVARLFPRCSLAVEALIRDALQGQSCTDKEIVEDAEAGVGRVLRVSTFRFDDDADGAGVGIIIDDITERWRLKQSLRATSNLYAMLLRSNQAISRCRNAPELYASICRVAVDTGHFRFAWIGVPSGGRIVPLAQAGIDNGYMRELVVTLDDDDPRSHGPTATSYKTGQSVVVNDFLSASQTLPWHGAAKRAGIAASATFAIPERGQVVAVLTLYATAVNFFTPELVATLSELPSSIAVALDAYLHEQERKRGEAELLLRDRAIRAVSQGICITDAQAVGHPIIYASPGFIAMTGYPLDEVIGRNCRFLQGEDTEPEAVQALRQALQARRECTVELLNYRRDGSPFWNSVAISPIRDEAGAISHFVGVQTDITERRKLDHQVRQSQKMEAIGRLAGGVAHDFNNILSVINGYSSLLLSRDLAPAQQRHGLEEINKAGSRAANLTSQLLAFSRQQVVRAQVLDLNSLVEDLSNMLARIDWRMTWEERSEIAKGVFRSLALLAGFKDTTRLVFLTDGHEAPPLNPDVKPEFTGKPGAVKGLVVGVGGLQPVPIPKLDAEGKQHGYWQAEDVMQMDSFRAGQNQREGRDTGAGGTEHLSSLKEDYLRELARQTGLDYTRLESSAALARALTGTTMGIGRVQATDIRWLFALGALVALCLAVLRVGDGQRGRLEFSGSRR